MNKSIPKNLQFLIAAGGVIVTLLNIWLAYKIAPLGQDIATIQIRVSAMEDQQDNYLTRNEWQISIEGVNKSLERIEKKLETFR